MMRKLLLCLILLSVTFQYVFCQPPATNKTTTSQQTQPKRVPGTEGKDPHPEAAINSFLPPFTMLQSDKTLFTDKDIPAGNSVVFVMFNPSCDHCISVGKELIKKMDSLKNTTLVFVTFKPNFNEIPAYLQNTGFSKYKKVHVGVANDSFILGHFMPNYIIPQVMIYNKKRKLKKIYYETINAEEVVKFLNMA